MSTRDGWRCCATCADRYCCVWPVFYRNAGVGTVGKTCRSWRPAMLVTPRPALPGYRCSYGVMGGRVTVVRGEGAS